MKQTHFLGKILFIEIKNIFSSSISHPSTDFNQFDVEQIKSILYEITHSIKGKILHEHFHQFSPAGITGFLLLSESHIAIHTWPEHQFASLEIFMCRDFDTEKVIQIIKQNFATEDIIITEKAVEG